MEYRVFVRQEDGSERELSHVQALQLVDRDRFRIGGAGYEVVAVYDQPAGASRGVIRAGRLIGRRSA
jgi:hypothetical protein